MTLPVPVVYSRGESAATLSREKPEGALLSPLAGGALPVPQAGRRRAARRSDRIQSWMALFFQVAILVLLTGSLAERRWFVSFLAALCFFLTFLPAIIARRLKVLLPIKFSLFTCLFLYASFALGEVREFYHRYWWWDVMLHSLSAIVLGMTGFLVVYTFHMTRRIKMAPVYVAVFSFGFALTLGTLWEIFEFGADTMLGMNMQKSGLEDTMTDLVVDALGVLLAAWVGYHYVKGGDSLFADRLIKSFVAKNPRFLWRGLFMNARCEEAKIAQDQGFDEAERLKLC
jgi:hypothetical protein